MSEIAAPIITLYRFPECFIKVKKANCGEGVNCFHSVYAALQNWRGARLICTRMRKLELSQRIQATPRERVDICGEGECVVRVWMWQWRSCRIRTDVIFFDCCRLKFERGAELTVRRTQLFSNASRAQFKQNSSSSARGRARRISMLSTS